MIKLPMSKYDLIQMFNRNNHYARETIQDINELIEDIDNDPKKFTYELSEELSQFGEKLNLCPLCTSNIIKLNSNYEFSEYQGNEIAEEIPIYGCENANCGYIKD